MVSCSSCDVVSLKWKKKDGRASTLPAQIIWAYYCPLLEFSGQYLKIMNVNSLGRLKYYVINRESNYSLPNGEDNSRICTELIWKRPAVTYRFSKEFRANPGNVSTNKKKRIKIKKRQNTPRLPSKSFANSKKNCWELIYLSIYINICLSVY